MLSQPESANRITNCILGPTSKTGPGSLNSGGMFVTPPSVGRAIPWAHDHPPTPGGMAWHDVVLALGLCPVTMVEMTEVVATRGVSNTFIYYYMKYNDRKMSKNYPDRL